ncbi:MAG: transglycosylase family protein [Paenisporosarcina sp.]
MRLLIRTMTLTIFMVFVIQPSAEAEVVSGSYWQKLPDAIRIHNEQIWYSVAYWNDVVRWNEAYQQALVKAAKQKTPKTQQQPKVTSDVVSQSGDKFDRLAMCESTMRQDAFNGVNKSYFQWAQSTWESVGGVGDPRNVSYEKQKEKAQYLASITNPGTQWPVCWYR